MGTLTAHLRCVGPRAATRPNGTSQHSGRAYPGDGLSVGDGPLSTEVDATGAAMVERPEDPARAARVREVAAQTAAAIERLRSASARLTANAVAQTTAIVEIARTARAS